jgi:molecular chaperone GrpE (heat shock protein)
MNPPFPQAEPDPPPEGPGSALPAIARDSGAPVVPAGEALPQVYAHLARLSATTEREAAELASIRTGLGRVHALVAALAEHLTHVAGLRPVDERLADMVTRIEASDERLNAVLDAVTKLGRTQFKSNALAEVQDQRVGAALATLQTIATRRDDAAEDEAAEWQVALSQARADGRSELAAELLPVLDGLEAALDNGRILIERHRLTATAVVRPTAPPVPRGWMARLRSAAGGSPTPSRPAMPPTPALPAPPMPLDALEAWLAGLALVRARCLDLLSAEGIVPIPALGQRFDAHLHVAVTAETRADVAPGTVVAVLRQGYRRRERILRYAEVTVARSMTEGSATTGSATTGSTTTESMTAGEP